MVKEHYIPWLDHIRSRHLEEFLKEELQMEFIEEFNNIARVTSPVLNVSVPCIYLLDYTTGKYLLVSDSVKTIMGYKTEDFLKGGLDFLLDKYHKKHLQLLNDEIFPDRLQILKQIPYQEHRNYIFTHNYPFKNRNGEYICLLQRNTILKSDNQGNPLITLGVATNITHSKNEIPVVQVVEKINSRNNLYDTETIFKKSYFPDPEARMFTKREKEILPYLASGLSSKEIANKLYLSEHTVINHRRNMMMKTASNNVTQLISYALKNYLI